MSSNSVKTVLVIHVSSREILGKSQFPAKLRHKIIRHTDVTRSIRFMQQSVF